MTKEEIKAIIAQKIEGQGTNVDAASVLPTILNWLVDHASEGIPVATEETVGGVKVGSIQGEDNGLANFSTGIIESGDEQARIGLRTLSFDGETRRDLTKEQFAEVLGITVDEVDLVFQGAFVGVYTQIGSSTKIFFMLRECNVYSGGVHVQYGLNDNAGNGVGFDRSGNQYFCTYYEM